MSKVEWRVDDGTHIVLRSAPFVGRKVEVNGQRVGGKWQSKRFDFVLPDGRAAAIQLKADALTRQTELTIDQWVIPDMRCVPKDLRCPACKADIQLLDEYCTRCGHALGLPSRFLSNRFVNGATIAIRVLAALFVIRGVLSLALLHNQAEQQLENLAQFQDHVILQTVDGVTYTAGELRKQVIWQQRGVLIENLILAALMLLLAWWSRRKPLAAILIATATFAAWQVIYAIIEPKTLMQGLILKVIIVAVLVRGIKGAIDLRTANG